VRRRRLFVLGGAIGACLVAGASAFADAARETPDEWTKVVEEARAQLREQAFTGVVHVSWHDAEGLHDVELEVTQSGGLVEIDADRTVVADESQRMLVDGQAWTTLARGGDLAAVRLAPGKYTIEHDAGARVAGRDAIVYEAKIDGTAVERVHVDAQTGLVLRRETLGADGEVVRSVSFTRVRLGTPAEVAPSTGAARTGGPEFVDALDRPYRDPASAADGFRLIGRWKLANDVAQLYYSDGVLGVSVFEQPGRLAWQELPEGDAEGTIAGHRARRYELPVGETWVFERDGMVYTCVGSTPTDELVAVAADVSAPADTRLDRLLRMVVSPFRW
jgi:sigma-E factor negative regulatory protein RseB